MISFVALTIGTPDPARVARFWADLLDREVVDDRDGLLLAGDPAQVGLRFVADDRPVVHPERVHLHVTSAHTGSQQVVVDRAVALGAVPLDVGQPPDERHVVLADPDGHPFCVIEPTNGFLRGTGVLGELACTGSRDVGLFWRDALDWPLVWDEHEETAVQAPAGGTKIARGGPPVLPHDGRDRHRFELGGSDGDVDRLIGLGAVRRGVDEHGVVLTDPDGTEFRVRG